MEDDADREQRRAAALRPQATVDEPSASATRRVPSDLSTPAAPEAASLRQARREVIQAEALGWLEVNPAQPGASVVTSLPDVSELSPYDFPAWRSWFLHAATRILQWLPPEGLAIFFQSDVHHRGAWVSKAHLILRAAEDADASLLWHKIACRQPAGTVALGRPGYSHLLCIARTPPSAPVRFGPDVLPECGFKPYSKAMGVTACALACRFLRAATQTRLIVDPFCGHGTLLAVANALGFDALGVDRSSRSCRAARKLTVTLED